MSVNDFLLCILIVLISIFGYREASGKQCPCNPCVGPKIKKVKVKRFWFLFNEGGISYKTKEVSLIVVIFVLAGYIINILALIAVIVCFCLDVNIVKWMFVLLVVNLIAWAVYAICIAIYNNHA